MAGVTRKGSGRPSYYYRFLGKSRLQRQRSRSRSRNRTAASRESLQGDKAEPLYQPIISALKSPPERTGRRRSMPGSSSDKSTPTMEATSTAATPFRVTIIAGGLIGQIPVLCSADPSNPSISGRREVNRTSSH
ncbi:hypothetical protein PAMP_013071 [Pampus punctatissimus]